MACHSSCQIHHIPDVSTFDTIIQMLEQFLDQIKRHADLYWTGQNWHSLNSEMHSIAEELHMIQDDITKAIETSDFCRLVGFEGKLQNFKNYVDQSQ